MEAIVISTMAKCDVCGNEYEKAFHVTYLGQTYTFDSFECAIFKLAPNCVHCGCRVIGHGIETPEGIYCCAHCAKHAGHDEAVDNVGASSQAT